MEDRNSDLSDSSISSTNQKHDFENSHEFQTNDVPPNIDFYRLTCERSRDVARPTMNQLIEGEIFERKDIDQIEDPKPSQSPILSNQSSKAIENKFGWIEGVFIRCLQSIIGIILFVRVSWVAGEAGLLLGLMVILLATSVTIITALSTSAITSNGEIKGGGVYYMISRTLGPEYGGSIGLIFAFANSVGGALYIVGLAETLCDIFFEYDIKIIDGGVNDIRLIGSVACIILTGIIVMGISMESKMQQIMLVPFLTSLFSFISGSFVFTEKKRLRGFTGYSLDTISHNLLPSFTKGDSFFSVFSIYFPAATGIMAGANISGDLKNPQTDIPKGTISAILVTTVIYIVTLFCTGATFVKYSDGSSFPEFINGSFVLPECFYNNTCRYGLLNNFQTLADLSIWSPLISIGIFSSTICSALTSLVSAPKILQAVAIDEMFPKIKFFAKSYGKNGDPRRAYAITFFISMCLILIGDLNLIAPIISNFFLCTYALVNYACFDASFSDSPGFRPAFQYYSMWVSLLGALVCILIMFIMDWVTAFATFVVFASLFLCLKKNKPNVNWGTSKDANLYKQTLFNLYTLNKQEEHVKNYRPQILLMSGDPSTRPGLVDFAASITRGTSLMLCGNVVTNVPTHKIYAMMHRCDMRAASWLKERGLKSFCVTISSKNLHTGAFHLTQTAGIGRMSPNILMFGYKSDWINRSSKLQEMNEYFKAIQAGFDKHMSVTILRNGSDGFDILDMEKKDNRPDLKYRKGDPPKGRLNLNPPSHNSFINRKGVHEFLSFIKRKQNNTVADSSTDPPTMDFQNSFDNSFQSTSAHMAQVPSPFCVVHKKAIIDVWWMSDDGGLTLLLPHILTLQRSYLQNAKLRVFTFSSSPAQTGSNLASMAALLNKFRIHYADLQIISDIGERPQDSTISKFNTLIAPFRTTMNEPDEGMITEDELLANKAKTYHQLRCGELLQRHSKQADLIVMTLPVPKKEYVSSSLYLAWLEMMTCDLPPILLVRGNHNAVLTFYS